MRNTITMLFAALFAAGCARAKVERVEWPAMGTVAAVQWKGGDGQRAVRVVRETLAEIERLLNAFDPASELNRLRDLDDDEILRSCDERVRPCYSRAFEFKALTSGAFDPRWRGPKTLDLGAIAKGYAVDCAVQAVAELGLKAEVLVDLGGNLKAASGTWRTAIARAGAADDAGVFDLRPLEAVATSGEYCRGKHIRDGRTQEAVTNDLVSVSVICADSAMDADALSTTLFILGETRGEEFLARAFPNARVRWIKSGKGEK